VVAEIESRDGSASLTLADLGSLAQVRELAASVLRDYDRLDLLVNNAGIGRGVDGGAQAYELEARRRLRELAMRLTGSSP
jgi:NAD(P)-dependent dehydrogenase (short-subunit alcohol dehydrogenase family)